MEHALSLVKVVGMKLLECKQHFTELGTVCDELQALLAAVEHLVKERAKERRFAGEIQTQLSKALMGLRDAVLDATENMKSQRAMMFFGTCIGKGAKKANQVLGRQAEVLRDLLDVAHAESSNVTASAVEEMAGGAAGNLIPHEGMRTFWREQFKNDFSLTWDQFKTGLLAIDRELKLCFFDDLPRVIEGLRGQLDVSRDGVVSVNEFSRMLTGFDVPPNADILETIRFHVSTSRLLLPCLSLGHTMGRITAVATSNLIFATGDSEGCVKLHIVLFDGIAELGLCNCGVYIKALEFVTINEKLHCMAAVPEAILFIDVWTLQIVSSTPSFAGGAAGIDTDGDFLFVRAFSPETRLLIKRRVHYPAEPHRIEFDTHVHLVHSSMVQQAQPLLDGRHVVTRTKQGGIQIWDYRDFRLLATLKDTAFCEAFSFAPPGPDGVPSKRLTVTSAGEYALRFEDVINKPHEYVALPLVTPYMISNTADVFHDSSAKYLPTKHAIEFCLWPGGAFDEAAVHEEVELPRSLRVSHVRIFKHSLPSGEAPTYGTALVVGTVEGEVTTLICRLPKFIRDKRQISMVSIVGRRFWTAHTRYTLRYLRYEASQIAALVAGGDRPLLISSCVDRRIHVHDVRTGKALLGIEVGTSLGFSQNIVGIIAHGPASIILLTADGTVVRTQFQTAVGAAIGGSGSPAMADTASTELDVACEEVRQLAQYCADGKLTPRTCPEFAMLIAQSSGLTRSYVHTALKAHRLHHRISGLTSADDIATAVQTLAEVKALVMQDAAAAEEQRSKAIREATKASAEGKKSPRAPASSATTPGLKGTDVFLSARRWTRPEGRLWLFHGSLYCRRCMKDLARDELVFQHCTECQRKQEATLSVARRDAGDNYSVAASDDVGAVSPPSRAGSKLVFVECHRCEAVIESAWSLCDACYDERKRALELIPCAGAVVGDFLIVGAVQNAAPVVYGPAGTLIKIHVPTMSAVDRVAQCYPSGFSNVVSTPALGGIFAASFGYDGIAFFRSEPGPLRDTMCGVLSHPQLPQTMAFEPAATPTSGHEKPPLQRSIVLIAASLAPDIRITRVTLSDGDGRATLVFKQEHVIIPPTTCTAVAADRTFLVAALRSGSVRVYSRRHQYAPVLDVQGHRSLRIPRIFITDAGILTTTTSGIANFTPYSYVRQVAAIVIAAANIVDGDRNEGDGNGLDVNAESFAVPVTAGAAETASSSAGGDDDDGGANNNVGLIVLRPKRRPFLIDGTWSYRDAEGTWHRFRAASLRRNLVRWHHATSASSTAPGAPLPPASLTFRSPELSFWNAVISKSASAAGASFRGAAAAGLIDADTPDAVTHVVTMHRALRAVNRPQAEQAPPEPPADAAHVSTDEMRKKMFGAGTPALGAGSFSTISVGSWVDVHFDDEALLDAAVQKWIRLVFIGLRGCASIAIASTAGGPDVATDGVLQQHSEMWLDLGKAVFEGSSLRIKVLGEPNGFALLTVPPSTTEDNMTFAVPLLICVK